MFTKNIFKALLFAMMLPLISLAQTTTSTLGGVVKSINGEPLVGATVVVTHEPTGTVYKLQSRTGGRYDVPNLNPGGPYKVEVSFVNFTTETKNEIYLDLGESYKANFSLVSTTATLENVTVKGVNKKSDFESKGGVETTIDKEKMANLPTVGRNIYDFLRTVPSAKMTSTGTAEGVSIAGQNNRYNSFYVDGAINNDVFGLSASGTNGGQSNIAPLSIDAIEQFQVMISPYDASVGNFTGGGINGITRSGSNKVTGSAYYYFRNQDLAGKTPTGDKSLATKFSAFKNQTYGARVGGPIIKNKLFYFLSLEQQQDQNPNPFTFSNYNGNTKDINVINGLANTLKTTYKYDPGGFLNNTSKINANRIAARVDWNLNNRNKLSLSYRYTRGERTAAFASSPTAINFYNNGVFYPNTTNSVSAELKTVVGRSSSNRLLVTYTDVVDDRSPLGQAFPSVTVFDGSGTIYFGSDLSSVVNLLKQKNVNLIDAFKFNVGKNSFTVGGDFSYYDAKNAFIQRAYGAYTYNSLSDFLTDARPRQYRVGYPISDKIVGDNTSSAAQFQTMQLSFFGTDDIRVNDNLTLTLGLRADYYSFLKNPNSDAFARDTALPTFAQYYDLHEAKAGQKTTIPISLSPRIGFTYKMPEQDITLRGGIGLFSGRLPLVWPGGTYNNTGITQGAFTIDASNNSTAWANWAKTPSVPAGPRFRSNPYGQYTSADFGILPGKGNLDIVSKEYKLPKLIRGSLAVDKRLGNGWTATVEGFFSYNINEIAYKNLNLKPPTVQVSGPDNRLTYLNYTNIKIPLRNDGSNPYDGVYLIYNNNRAKGYAYNGSIDINKKTRGGFAFDVNYSYGSSIVTQEATSSVNASQWSGMQSVNGRNQLTRSISDFDMGHKITAYISKKFTYANKALATTFTVLYTGLSGQPLSYVNGNSLVGDGGTDLMYIPTASEVKSMTFTANTITNPNGTTTTYTPTQQQQLFEKFLSTDDYTKGHRGEYSERNGARMLFSNKVDIKVAQDFNFRVSGRRYSFQVTYDIFNFGNMLNRDWGHTYYQSSFNSYTGITTAYKATATTVTPSYKFTPPTSNPNAFVSTSSIPVYASRWISQLGLRFNF